MISTKKDKYNISLADPFFFSLFIHIFISRVHLEFKHTLLFFVCVHGVLASLCSLFPAFSRNNFPTLHQFQHDPILQL